MILRRIRGGTALRIYFGGKSLYHVGKNKNRHMIRQFKVDGEVVAAGDMSPRCDYLLLNDDAKTSYYIELKGSDLVKAIEQIEIPSP